MSDKPALGIKVALFVIIINLLALALFGYYGYEQNMMCPESTLQWPSTKRTENIPAPRSGAKTSPFNPFELSNSFEPFNQSELPEQPKQNCYATVDRAKKGTVRELSSQSKYYKGRARFTCDPETREWSIAEDARCAASCAAQDVSWSSSCTGKTIKASNNEEIHVVNSTENYTGHAKFRCNARLNQWEEIPGSSRCSENTCSPRQIVWGENCIGKVKQFPHGTIDNIENMASGYFGSVNVKCDAKNDRIEIIEHGSLCREASVDCKSTKMLWGEDMPTTPEGPCYAVIADGTAGETRLLHNQNPGLRGQAEYTCDKGQWATLSHNMGARCMWNNCLSGQRINWADNCYALTKSGMGNVTITNQAQGFEGKADIQCNRFTGKWYLLGDRFSCDISSSEEERLIQERKE